MSGKPTFQIDKYGPVYQMTPDGPVQVRPAMTRAEYLRKLTEMVKNGAKIEFFSPKTPQNWAKTHNPAQDIEDLREKGMEGDL